MAAPCPQPCPLPCPLPGTAGRGMAPGAPGLAGGQAPGGGGGRWWGIPEAGRAPGMQGVTCTVMPPRKFLRGERRWEAGRLPDTCLLFVQASRPLPLPLRDGQICNDCPFHPPPRGGPCLLKVPSASSRWGSSSAEREPRQPHWALLPSWVPHSVLPWLFAGRSRRRPSHKPPLPGPPRGLRRNNARHWALQRLERPGLVPV